MDFPGKSFDDCRHDAVSPEKQKPKDRPSVFVLATVNGEKRPKTEFS